MSKPLTIDDCKSIVSNYLITVTYIKQELTKLVVGEFNADKFHELYQDLKEIDECMAINDKAIAYTVTARRMELEAANDREGLRTLGHDIDMLITGMKTVNSFIPEIMDLIAKANA